MPVRSLTAKHHVLRVGTGNSQVKDSKQILKHSLQQKDGTEHLGKTQQVQVSEGRGEGSPRAASVPPGGRQGQVELRRGQVALEDTCDSEG